MRGAHTYYCTMKFISYLMWDVTNTSGIVGLNVTDPTSRSNISSDTIYNDLAHHEVSLIPDVECDKHVWDCGVKPNRPPIGVRDRI